ncbi:MAG: N-acetylglucosamine-6-phosphate deacetylase [Armatimonadetes bacterium]|nr:N-acetylglucosamine-6-phosphate deacetylase [Armatimonadota bacterium]
MSEFFDLQVNGYGGVDFNGDLLDADALHTACERLHSDGVGGILATIISEKLEVMEARLSHLARLRGADPLAQKIIAGVHIEGPFLNESDGFRGAHPLDAMRWADVEAMQRLLDAAQGLTRLVTLAPERDAGLRVTRMLREMKIVVAAGHCDPTLDELEAATDAGLRVWTHLGNGCPMNLPRHDNIIQRALSLSERLWLCFIADGVHVPFFALKNYLRAAGIERCIIVTDAIAPASLGPGNYTLGRWKLQIGADMVARAPDGAHLVGAAITMRQSIANLQEKVGLSSAETEQLTVTNPRRALSLCHGVL